jgi:hypothetical protein
LPLVAAARRLTIDYCRRRAELHVETFSLPQYGADFSITSPARSAIGRDYHSAPVIINDVAPGASAARLNTSPRIHDRL